LSTTLTGSVAVGAAAVQVIATATPLRNGVRIVAANANTGKVYVGLSSAVTANSAAATDGYELAAGQSLWVDVWAVPGGDLSNLYVIASAASQKAFFIGY
jgi:hypothetical protein